MRVDYIGSLSFAGVMVLALAIMSLWPGPAGDWRIAFQDSQSLSNFLARAGGLSFTIIELEGTASIIVKPDTSVMPEDFYTHGAILVTDAAAGFGCGGSTRKKWER